MCKFRWVSKSGDITKFRKLLFQCQENAQMEAWKYGQNDRHLNP